MAGIGAIASLSGILAAGILTYLFYNWYRLSHIPGPFWPSLSKYWLVQQSLKGQMHSALKEVTDEYGSLARVGPNDLVTNDPDILRKMMAVRSPYTRGPWYDAMRLDPARNNLLSLRDEEAHTNLRNKMAAGYSGKENSSMEGTIDKQIQNLINLIERKYLSTNKKSEPMDLGQKGQFFTLDVISDLAFGKALGFLDKDEDVFEYIKITEQYIPAMLVMANIPWLARLTHTRLFRSLLPNEADKLGFGAFIGVAKQITRDRFQPGAEPQKDMMGSFIRHGLTQEEVAGETLLQVIAGSDTSAATIRVVLLNLMSSPPCYRKLQEEIDSAIKTGKISSPITDSEAKQLPFLQAVIKEGLRITPPATGIFNKTVPKGGDVLNGIFVPEGTQIGSSFYGVHHSKKIFGEDADLFRPERWLEAEGDTLATMMSTSDLIFHYGKYQCLGKPVALMELNKIYVELLRSFDFAIVNVNQPAKFLNAGIWIITDFWVRVTRREESP
ncbi:cytochrome P450 [Mollisia scopiformis]|uniref:Cytochrome P450 monooxygenase ABA1 n=1 Tax=Mollisia scopiformis TaxID=149040 RepID=A0A194X6Y0_MOLSC|nr:cytochrome P450 [Mollisia scopiformis]KUJ15933.1 cytochrome P450 [Mollisia scopiformis]